MWTRKNRKTWKEKNKFLAGTWLDSRWGRKKWEFTVSKVCHDLTSVTNFFSVKLTAQRLGPLWKIPHRIMNNLFEEISVCVGYRKGKKVQVHVLFVTVALLGTKFFLRACTDIFPAMQRAERVLIPHKPCLLLLITSSLYCLSMEEGLILPVIKSKCWKQGEGIPYSKICGIESDQCSDFPRFWPFWCLVSAVSNVKPIMMHLTDLFFLILISDDVGLFGFFFPKSHLIR